MKKKNIGIFAVLLLIAMQSFSQTKSLCINEVMPYNKSDIVDDYGIHHPWIEIFNTSFATVDMRSCFITNDKSVLNPKLSASERMKMMYPIPKGDVHTELAPRQYALFYADGFPKKGNFHLNFTLDSIHSNWIALYDANGYTLIDSITIPVLQANCSYGLKDDGIKTDGWEIKGINGKYVTPNTNNRTLDSNLKINKFKEKDPYGISMAIIAMSVVFFSLLLLYIAFKVTGKIGADLNRKNAMKVKGITDKAEAIEKSIGDESGDVFAAMAMALHEYQNNIHDVEDLQLTISKIKRNYSPWSSKIYMLRHRPKR